MALSIGKTYTVKGIGTFKVMKATAKGKAKKAVLMKNDEEVKTIHFGDPDMRNSPGTEKGDNYCSRSRTLNTYGFNANTLSRIDWNCKGSKSTDEAAKKVMDSYRKTMDEGKVKGCDGSSVHSWSRLEQGLLSGETFFVCD